jgi:hypothetical protein
MCSWGVTKAIAVASLLVMLEGVLIKDVSIIHPAANTCGAKAAATWEDLAAAAVL